MSRLGNVALTAAASAAPILAVHAGLTAAGESLRDIPPDTLTRSPWQPRTEVDRGEEFTTLVESIRAHGILEPLLTRALPDGSLELLAGERRLEAAKVAGLAVVPVRVLLGLSDPAARAIAITENLARKDLTTWEEAHAVRQLRDARAEAGLPADVRSLEAEAGRKRSLISQLLRIADTLTPETVAAAERASPGLVHGVDKLPKASLYAAASATEAADRVRLLALALGPVAPAAPRARAALPAPVFRVTMPKGGGVSVRIMQPVDTLTPEDATAALEALTPVVKALRARARS